MITTTNLKLGAFAIAAAAGLAACAGYTWSVHQWGWDNGRAKCDSELSAVRLEAEIERGNAERARAEMLERVSFVESEARRMIEAAKAKTAARITTIERANRENPTFAATVRPADHQRVRDDQLADIEAAASRSADLSSSILRGVPTADQGDGQ